MSMIGLSVIKNFENQIKSYGDEATDFHDKEFLKSGLIILAYQQSVWILFSRKMKTIICKCFKRVQTYWKRKKKIRHITSDLEIHSHDSDEG